MTATATAPCPRAERRAAPARPRPEATCTTAQSAIMGKRKTAENLATHARPKTTALRTKAPAPGVSRCRHHAPIEASMKSEMQTSDVAYPPCARKVGLKAKKARDTNPPAVPKSRLDQQKTSAPVATLKSAVIARAAISLGKWSSPVS